MGCSVGETVTRRSRHLFGTPAISSKKSLKYGYRRADIVLWNYYAPGRLSTQLTARRDMC